jgi:hypothetical protein
MTSEALWSNGFLPGAMPLISISIGVVELPSEMTLYSMPAAEAALAGVKREIINAEAVSTLENFIG